MPAATINEVAAHAGLSRATAARALGGYGSVSEAARERALASARALRYRPNLAARQTRTGARTTIGVVVSDIANGFFGQLVRTISDNANLHGLDVVVMNTDENALVERQAVQVLLNQRAAGVIIVPSSTRDNDHLLEVQRTDTPVVIIDRRVTDLTCDRVTADNCSGAKQVMHHLIDHGHRRIGYLTSCIPPRDHEAGRVLDLSTLVTSAGDRISAYVQALSALGSDPFADLVFCDFGPEAAYREALRILTALDRPTAIFASDGVIALGALRAIVQLGLNIPGDIALVAGDEPDWVQVTTPALSAIWQPVTALGSTAVDLLDRRLSDPTADVLDIVLETTFHPRASTAAHA